MVAKIREVTEKHNIVLILDEVQAGFARSGKMFAFEHAGIEPDVVVMSKAVGGSLPLAVLGIKRKFDAWQPAGHTGTSVVTSWQWVQVLRLYKPLKNKILRKMHKNVVISCKLN